MTVLDHLKVWSCPLKSGQAIKLGWQAYEPAVVVTGASEGIGRAFAELLTDKEFTPLLISRTRGRLRAAFPWVLSCLARSNFDVRPDGCLVNATLFARLVAENATAFSACRGPWGNRFGPGIGAFRNGEVFDP